MKTLGIDLSSQPMKTAACLIDWDSGATKKIEILARVDDEQILRLVDQCDKIGIDAPFGWPLSFVEFLNRSSLRSTEWTPHYRDSLCFRITDLRVQEYVGIRPLAVAADKIGILADKIGILAMRCAGLLDRMNVLDRSGSGEVVEVYPAAALKVWDLPYKGYKPKNQADVIAKAKLSSMFDNLCADHAWLGASKNDIRQCSHDDHAFDALIASLVARAAHRDLIIRPGEEEAEPAMREGWIAIPLPHSLNMLIDTASPHESVSD